MAAAAHSRARLDRAGEWFWEFLKQELAPYPGRLWTVSRMVIASTIAMLLIMTFRLPNAFQAALFTLLLSRESPQATWASSVRTVAAFAAGTAYAILGVMMFIGDPMVHFLWIVTSFFLAFFVIRIVTDYGSAVAFGFLLAGAIPLWDQNLLPVNVRLNGTLWLAASVAMGALLTTLVAFVFQGVHPESVLFEGIEDRLKVVQNVLDSLASQRPIDAAADKKLSQYTVVGPSGLRRLLNRSGYEPNFKAQMNAAVSLVGRLVDLAGSLQLFQSETSATVSEADRERMAQLAGEIAELHNNLRRPQFPERSRLHRGENSSALPFVPEMERAVALIPHAFGSGAGLGHLIVDVDPEDRPRLFVRDAFSNPEHVRFALRGCLAAMICYVIYTGVAWPGISTAVATCIITALSTTGSSRQKQFLRLAGAITGGFIFGMGAQVFILPYLDSIAGFSILFAVVTAVAAWFATASSRLSYFGVQLALAYYLINLQEFTIQTSLAVARDRVVGVLLGLVVMWLVFDRLWVRNAVDEMQAIFAHNLELLAQLAQQLLEDDPKKALSRIRKLRDEINQNFSAVNAQADAVIFEFGPSRQRKLEIRDQIRHWQPRLRTLLLLQITLVQYRLPKPPKDLPDLITAAQRSFDQAISDALCAIAAEVNGKPASAPVDLRASQARLEHEIRQHYRDIGSPISARANDVLNLVETITSVLESLHTDIHRALSKPVAEDASRLRLSPEESAS